MAAAGDLQLRLVSAPFMRDPEYMGEFYELLGKIVILWSRLEHQIDTTQLLCAEIGKHHKLSRRVQNGFGSKLRFLRQMLRECPPLNAYSDYFETLSADLIDASKDRNVLVHSSFSQFLPDRRGIKLGNLRYDGTTLYLSSHPVTIDQLKQLLDYIDGLNTKLLHVSFGVQNVHRRYEGLSAPKD